MHSRSKQVRIGDKFLCYVRREFMWVGILEAMSEAYESDNPLWDTDSFPIRIDVRHVVNLPLSAGLPFQEMEGKLSFYPEGKPVGWAATHLQGSPRLMKSEDGASLERAILTHEDARQPDQADVDIESTAVFASRPMTEHSDMQRMLTEFGLDTGCSVWIPKADRTRIASSFPDFSTKSLLDSLPPLFGGAAQPIVQNIDVLWLKGATIVAAFEVEQTTAIYSGLLRMSDLVSTFPNVRFPFFVVAPESRRSAVRNEILRPTFQRLQPRLSEECSFISNERLRELVSSVTPDRRRFVDPSIVSSVAETFT